MKFWRWRWRKTALPVERSHFEVAAAGNFNGRPRDVEPSRQHAGQSLPKRSSTLTPRNSRSRHSVLTNTLSRLIFCAT